MNLNSIDTEKWTNKIAFHYDLEFDDRGAKGLDVISLGGVFQCRRIQAEFYGINTDYFHTDSWRSFLSGKHGNLEWMMDNVFAKIVCIPAGEGRQITISDYLERPTHRRNGFEVPRDTQPLAHESDGVRIVVGPLQEIGKALIEIGSELGASETNPIQPCGYFSAHDHVGLSQCFGSMIDMPKEWRFYSFDLRVMMDVFGLNPECFKPVTPHHALADARAQRQAYADVVDAIREQMQLDVA